MSEDLHNSEKQRKQMKQEVGIWLISLKSIRLLTKLTVYKTLYSTKVLTKWTETHRNDEYTQIPSEKSKKAARRTTSQNLTN